MYYLLCEAITIFSNPIERIINSSVVKWVVCNSKVLFTTVFNILQVTVKIFLLWSHRIGCPLSLGLSLNFSFLVTWSLLLYTKTLLHNRVWPQLPQTCCLISLLLLLHRIDNRSKLNNLMLSVLCASSLNSLAHFCFTQLILLDLNCLLFCWCTPLLSAAILNWVYRWIHDRVSHVIWADGLAFSTKVSHSFIILLPRQWVKCCCLSLSSKFLGFERLWNILITLFNDFIFLFIATDPVIDGTHNLFYLLYWS